MLVQVGILSYAEANSSELNSGDTSTFQTVVFDTPFPAGVRPMVFPMVQTFNGSETPGLRIAEINRFGFKIRLNELVGNGQVYTQPGHNNESIAWIAISPLCYPGALGTIQELPCCHGKGK